MTGTNSLAVFCLSTSVQNGKDAVLPSCVAVFLHGTVGQRTVHKDGRPIWIVEIGSQLGSRPLINEKITKLRLD